jgi:hypothetical protein
MLDQSFIFWIIPNQLEKGANPNPVQAQNHELASEDVSLQDAKRGG